MTQDPAVTAARSENMARIRSRDTKPEIVVRQRLHREGYRFRLHRRDLPGSPDIVIPRIRLAILVHGCFWHQHPGCTRATVPGTRRSFWTDKFARNAARDAEVQTALEGLGWRVAIIWECETQRPEVLDAALRGRLDTAAGCQ